jgi:hypothetical protein
MLLYIIHKYVRWMRIKVLFTNDNEREVRTSVRNLNDENDQHMGTSRSPCEHIHATYPSRSD